jgi:hypothetical protein
MENGEEEPLKAEIDQEAPPKAKDGCFYTISALMILFGLIPAIIGVVLFVLWLISGD